MVVSGENLAQVGYMATMINADKLLASGVDIVGAEDFDIRKNGISPRRLPEWTRVQLPAMLETIVRMPSGVRIRFRTNSTSIGIKALTTSLVPMGGEPTPVAFNLEIDKTLRVAANLSGNQLFYDPANPGNIDMRRGVAVTTRFEDLGGDEKDVQVWLPHNAYVELQALELDDGARLLAPSAPQRIRTWIHHGSSISHCMEAREPALIWPAVAARSGGVDLQNLGFGGQCHMDQFIARVMRDKHPDLMSLKVGINIINMDSMRERVFVPALHGFIDTLREGNPVTPLLLISPVYCPSAEDAPGPTIPNSEGKYRTISGHSEIRIGCLTLNRVRRLIASVVAARQDTNLHYLNGLELFGEQDAGDLPDDLHPNPEGYLRMGERFSNRVFAPGGAFAE